MSEQYFIDWINSLDIPNSVLVNKIEDLYKKNNILINIISIILNKNIKELLKVTLQSKSLNYLRNISKIMDMYFDYNYDYSNINNLKKNTLLLLKFLKSRYPKQINNSAINYRYEQNRYNKTDILNDENNYYLDKNEYIRPNSKKRNGLNNNNENNRTSFKNRNISTNSKGKTSMDVKLVKPREIFNGNKKQISSLNDYPMSSYNLNTVPYRSQTLNNFKKNKNGEKNKLMNKTKNNYSYSNINPIYKGNAPKKNNNTFFNEISNNIKPNQKLSMKTQYKANSSKDMLLSKKLKNSDKNKHLLNYENYNSSDKITQKGIPTKVPNYNLKTKDKPVLKQEDNFYNDQKYILENKHNSFENLSHKKENKLSNNENIMNDIHKERFILDFLNKIKIINEQQKNADYLWKVLIPDLKDGYIIGKLINYLEKKNNNYLKGITKETFYKVNIYFNWQKITQFLINRNLFNSIYLYQKNFYEDDRSLFYFLYDLLHFYFEKENINKTAIKNFIDRTHNKSYNNISGINLANNLDFSKNYSHINKNINKSDLKDKSNHSTPITIMKNENKDEKMKKFKQRPSTNLKMSVTPSISEIMNIRKSLNYVHRENKSFVLFPKNDQMIPNKSETSFNLKNKEKIFIKGENKSFDKKVEDAISFLETIGINTSEINFFCPEMKVFKDGILMLQIISQLESNNTSLPKINLNPKNPATAINNHRLIINFLIKYKKNFPVELTGKERELYKSNPKFILKFLLVLKSIYSNEIYYHQKVNDRNEKKNTNHSMRINPKNIDKSERMALPLSQELRNKFLVNDNAKIWA